MKKIYHTEIDEIRDLFLGKSVVKAGDGLLELNDGTILKMVGNEGGCACSSGDYYLTNLNTHSNIITSVDVKEESIGEYSDTVYKLFVYSEGIGTPVAEFEGNDGNGYYGTGFQIEVLGQVRD